ncbi:hypothetical protein PoB_006729000 [Plakobranchus ocellatus]|uniref:Uncharacterized protein n=1 Tax=Plakobranchus ocellatus TaxID=259542 RepID=A0AAV4D9Z7_9GAST|nr:hypothetical protein PoB_006729000 [Plakobranchus ocellatus]
MRDTGCEGVVEEEQLTRESCLLIRIENTALLAEKAVVNLRTLYGEVQALCIAYAICDVIVRNVRKARGPKNPDMSVMESAATTRVR